MGRLTKTLTCNAGEAIQFDTSKELAIKSFKIHFDPVQDLHGYDHPWPAGGGKNLIDYLSCVGVGARNGTDSVYGDNTSISGTELTINQSYVNNGGILKGVGTFPLSTGEYVTISGKATLTGTSKLVIGISNYDGGGTNNIDINVTIINGRFSVKLNAKSDYAKTGIFIQPQGSNSTVVISEVMVALGQTEQPYSPYSNICPIQGWDGVSVTRCGKNLLPYPYSDSLPVTKNGIMFTDIGDGGIHIQGTATQMTYFNLYGNSNTPIPQWVKPNTSYEIKPKRVASKYFVQFILYGDKAFTNVDSFTTPSDLSSYTGFAIVVGVYSNAEMNDDIYPVFELTPTSISYEPYQGESYDIDFPQSEGTVYGGYVDLKSGELVVTHKYAIYNGTENWSFSSTSKSYFALWNQDASSSNNDLTQIANWLVAGDVHYTTYGKYRAQTNGAVVVGNIIDLENEVYKWQNVNEFKSYLANNPLQICYELETPQVIPLTNFQKILRTLKGSNYIFANTNGRIEIEYEYYDTVNLYANRRKILMNTPHLHSISAPAPSFKSDMGYFYKDFKIHFGPVQDLNGYYNPWPAGGGTIPFDGIFEAGSLDSKGLNRSLNVGLRTPGYIPVQKNATYTLTVGSYNSSIGTIALGVSYYSTNDFVTERIRSNFNNYRSITFTIQSNENIRYVRFEVTFIGSDGYSVLGNLDPSYVSDVQLTSNLPESNICPISGWDGVEVTKCGKNVIYPKYSGRTHNGITYTVNENGTITTSGTATGSSYAAENLVNQQDKMIILPPGTYALSGGVSNDEVAYLGGKYVDGETLPTSYDRGTGATVTYTKPAYVYPQISVNNGTSSNRTFEIQLELGSTATPYEPYQGEHTTAFGKNICPINTMRTTHAGIDYTLTNNGIWVHGTSTNASYSWGGEIPYSAAWLKLPAGTYTFSVTDMFGTNQIDGYVVFMGFDIDGNAITNFTLHNGSKINTRTFTNDVGLYYGIYVKSGLTVDTVVKIQVELGSTSTAYEPYIGTVYGGTLDLKSGELVVDRAMVDLGTLSWTYQPISNNKLQRFSTSGISGTVSRIATESGCMLNLTSSIYKPNVDPVYGRTIPYVMCVFASTGVLYIIDDRYTSSDAFKSAMSGVQLVYELATPQTYQLTPETIRTLKGINNVFSNANGNIDISFYAH